MMQMVGSFAEFERAMLKERTKAGVDATRKYGRMGAAAKTEGSSAAGNHHAREDRQEDCGGRRTRIRCPSGLRVAATAAPMTARHPVDCSPASQTPTRTQYAQRETA